jgi:hypothetical protein
MKAWSEGAASRGGIIGIGDDRGARRPEEPHHPWQAGNGNLTDRLFLFISSTNSGFPEETAHPFVLG